jgi:hypothetical protein
LTGPSFVSLSNVKFSVLDWLKLTPLDAVGVRRSGIGRPVLTNIFERISFERDGLGKGGLDIMGECWGIQLYIRLSRLGVNAKYG